MHVSIVCDLDPACDLSVDPVRRTTPSKPARSSDASIRATVAGAIAHAAATAGAIAAWSLAQSQLRCLLGSRRSRMTLQSRFVSIHGWPLHPVSKAKCAARWICGVFIPCLTDP
eukprot:6213981-Pleurochrysis_carterae.AAC.2